MIRRLRLQVVAVCMLLVTAVLGGAFFFMYTAARDNIRDSTQELLRRVVIRDPRVDRGQTGIMIGGDQVQLPYFTVEVWGNTVYVTGGTYSDLENTDTLREILQSCMEQERETGNIPAYNLRYLRVNSGFFQRIAFVDVSMETASLQSMIRSTLQIGAAALLVLLGISVLLARLVTRPVGRAWNQQRQFLSDASHELKTPLTVILSNAELLDDVSLEERPARWADNILSEARQMRSLVEEMLTLARADSLVRTGVFSEVSLSDAATDCALLFEPVAFDAGKSLGCEGIDPDVLVTGDADRLKQAISVLLDNAIKYGAEGTSIALALRKTDRQARLQVENQGPPIPPEQLRRLFERFYRADASRGEQSGFGLGLSIAQSIAAEHKGTLRAESDEASTRFILTLPLLRK
ncbi:HAMP domain-containing sensor histidine kinase [Oscillibacter sp.]|uniref:sensor histidine kinase n=1 Tax=Oscillibacter sp. TaxID=1945593 RepID=UPI00289BFF06|nr:HAMP domain-containing sensor histidine kinase [Oscillibacter sp.]